MELNDKNSHEQDPSMRQGASAFTNRRTSRFTTQTARDVGARVVRPGVLADDLQHAGQAGYLRGLLGAR
jgi:hypothetical protein